MATTTFTEPRQVRVVACELLAPPGDKPLLSLMPFLQEVNLYESIFDNTMSGTVTILEDIGIVELAPIVGVEYLWFEFETDDDSIPDQKRKFKRMFRIIKVGEMSYPKHDFRLYKLELSTHEFISSIAHRVTRQYKNWSCKDAVEDILKRDLGVEKDRLLNVEDTFGKVTITIPNYTPLQAINFFTLLSQTKTKKESNFVFFETLDGFHFTSVAKLIEDGKKELEKSKRVYRVDPGRVTGQMTTDEIVRNSLHRIWQDQTVDLLADIAGGMLRSRMVHFDFMARKIQHEEDSRYTETFKQTTHLGDHPVYPENYDKGVSKNVRTFTFPSNAWSKDSKWFLANAPETEEQRLHESILLHNRQMKELGHIQTLIELPGHPNIRAGAVMDIRYPATRVMALSEGPKTASVPEPVDGTPLFSGPHLVTSVRHMMTPLGSGQFEYAMHIKVCRDSFSTNLVKFGTGETYA
jgi:hypothetical protein